MPIFHIHLWENTGIVNIFSLKRAVLLTHLHPHNPRMCFVDSEACLARRKHIALFPILSGPRKAWYVITEAIASEDYAIVQSIWIFDVSLNLPIRRGSWATVGNGRVDRGCSLPFTITIVLLMNVPCRCKRYSVQRTYSIFRINIIPAILWVGKRTFIIIYTDGKEIVFSCFVNNGMYTFYYDYVKCTREYYRFGNLLGRKMSWKFILW